MRAEQADDVSPPCRLLNMKLRICHARYVARGRSDIAKKSPTLAGCRCRTRREVRCVQLGEVGNVNKMAYVRVWPKN